MKILICGGRNYRNEKFVNEFLDKFVEEKGYIHAIITGGARGADKLAEKYAMNNRIALVIFPANWDIYGKAAGPIRNQEMLIKTKPDYVIAFPGGNGTIDMVNKAKSQGFHVIEADKVDTLEGNSMKDEKT